MKIIELLNKISNGEEVPERIKIYQDYYIWYDNEMTGNVGYCKEPLQSDGNSFLTINTLYDLNYEVEIIEEEPRDIEVCGSLFTRSEYNRLAGIKEDKKIEKIDVNHLQQIKKWKRAKILGNKINEIIDKLNSMEK